jgi:hypothetical protein
MSYTEDCEHCEGTGVIQSGSLEGNYCKQCVNGQVLTQAGLTLASLVKNSIRAEEILWA